MNLPSLIKQPLQKIGFFQDRTPVNIEPPNRKIIMGNFGDPEPVLDGQTLFQYGHCPQWQEWYELPYDIEATSRLFRATSHHTSALIVKRNILSSTFIPHPLLSRQQFNALALNLLLYANTYAHLERNRFNGIIKITARPTLAMRRGLDLNRYFQVTQYINKQFEFAPEDIIHIYEPDTQQEVYGVPDYLSSVNAILLNEAATLFRRRYYKNGAHAGFILHMTDALQTQEDVDDLEYAMENSKGAGNFRNLLLYTPGGNKDGVKVIPIAEVAAKDEFYNIKIASRDDQLAGHRTPPQLIGVVPQNAGGFGDIEKAAKVFYYNEILYYQNMLKSINDRVGFEVVKFDDYALIDTLKNPA
ncbi:MULTISPECIES: phage portal protein [unclassified Acinetobacter]|uniref:phage portal protein n=1 Tax=unclassified Acinetobacter TaxID=196816 RepID=UPI0022AC65DC|nr:MULTISPECIES: phage portal protein [unclassified Acinetobacter]WAU72938.1 phage portal protein [Acinetobacter sp. TR11]WAU76033.1 phage portal protein [Acinetobacter sp. TR3]